MSHLTYERSKHSRVVASILVSPWTLLSKRKHHWFSWSYVDGEGVKRFALLRIDKEEQLIYRHRVPVLTGLELESVIEEGDLEIEFVID